MPASAENLTKPLLENSVRDHGTLSKEVIH